MTVHFFATLRDLVGARTTEVTLVEGMTVADLVTSVVERFPALRPELLDEQGNLYRHVHVFVNGRDAPYLAQGMATPLKPTDRINIFPAVAGG